MTVEILDVDNGPKGGYFEKAATKTSYINGIRCHGLQSPLSPPATRHASPTPSRQTRPHTRMTYQAWENLRSILQGEDVRLDGESLDISSVVAVAKYGSKATLERSEKVLDRINRSVSMLHETLAAGELVYGVNTGFGGSADTRTSDLSALQRSLVQHQTSGILGNMSDFSTSNDGYSNFNSMAMPTQWARGLMLSRLNSIVRGHSGVSLPVIDTILGLLEHDMTPMIPLRGSISASGDLIPNAYVASAIQGSPDIFVKTGKSHDFKVIPSDQALKLANLAPINLAAKEGLGLLNGTAASASVASLAIYEANHLALLSQVLTAMGCEALRGNAESFHPFIAAVRPHGGQVEAAANILSFLSGSRIAKGHELQMKVHESGLCQDRYALRTSSQWIGPQLEDLILATDQVTVELNSTTDNPLINVSTGLVHHGGNFQAASLTSAMEKTRLALQMIAKMLFAQATEIINPALNRGLPPNLVADDPSISFMCKGIDISMAGYYSEIAFLSNPVSTHVQSAEMHNQALNSLALISARYTMEVVEIMSMMSASYIVMVCQALDLRVLQMTFLAKASSEVVNVTDGIASRYLAPTASHQKINAAVWDAIKEAWDETTTLDLNLRCETLAELAGNALISALSKSTELAGSASDLLTAINTWKQSLSSVLSSTYETTRQDMFSRHEEITPQYLGQASSKLYTYVRRELKIPFHRGLIEDPTHVLKNGQQASFPPEQRKTIGTLISTVYEAIRDGRLIEPVMTALGENMGCKDTEPLGRNS